jgi:AraC-like DNA-binding protein
MRMQGAGGTRFRDTTGIVAGAVGAARPRLERYRPGARVASIVDHYWYLDWAVDQPFTQEVLPPPAVNIVFHEDGSRVFGAVSGRHMTTLPANGRVLGVRVHPGRFRPFLGAPLSLLASRSVPVTDVFGGSGRELSRRVLTAADPRAMTGLVDEFLADRLPSPSDDVLAAEAVDLVASDRSINRAGELAGKLGMNLRRLQRLFADHVGLGPKAVIRSYRIREIMARAHPGADWSGLAADFGYSDQAHFSREFTSLVGVAPTRYARRLAMTSAMETP